MSNPYKRLWLILKNLQLAKQFSIKHGLIGPSQHNRYGKFSYARHIVSLLLGLLIHLNWCQRYKIVNKNLLI